MNSFNTVLFDLDGTLTDSAPGIINCYRHALNVMGFDEPEDIMRVVGPPLYDSFAELCGMNSEQVQEAVRVYRQRYADTGLFENNVYDGIPEMLKKLKDSGIKLCVATSKPEIFAVKILEKFGLAEFFDVIGGADINGTRNAKQEVIEYVLSRAGITGRTDVLMVGDRSHDIIGAKQCGLPCMAVLWGYGSCEEFEQHKADIIVNTPQEAAEIIIAHKRQIGV